MDCGTICTTELPVYLAGGCNTPPVKKGGFSRVVFIRCNATPPSDPCDAAAWQALIDAGNVRISGELMGSKPLGSDTLLRTASCRPEQPISGQKTWQFTDYNTSLSLQEYDFWNHFKIYARQYKVGFLDCEDRFYAFYKFGLAVDEEKDDNINGTSRITGTFTVEELEMLIPVKIPAATIDLLLTEQSKDYSSGEYADDFSISCESINISPETESYSIDTGVTTDVVVTIEVDRSGTACATPMPLVLNFAGMPAGLSVVASGVPTLTDQEYTFTANAVTPGTYRIDISVSNANIECETNITHILLTII